MARHNMFPTWEQALENGECWKWKFRLGGPHAYADDRAANGGGLRGQVDGRNRNGICGIVRGNRGAIGAALSIPRGTQPRHSIGAGGGPVSTLLGGDFRYLSSA